MATKELPNRSLRDVQAELKKLGTAQGRKIYGRHGVTGATYGVSYANQHRIAKSIKGDHKLALKLWDSNNHDCRILATMILDPTQLSSKELDAWVKSLDNYVISDAFAKVAAAHPLAKKKAEVWRKKTRQEWVSRVGWMLVASIAFQGNDEDKAWLDDLIPLIVETIHGSKNRIKDAMNYALIAIGGSHKTLTKKALRAADQLGVVEVDHGETGCKTRPAREYIESMWARKTAKKSTKKKATTRKATKKGQEKKRATKKAAKKSATR